MANDDLTQKLSGNDEDRTTQPTLMAVLALVREVKDSVDRLSGQVTELRSEVTELRSEVTELRSEVTRLSTRLDEVESRLARDIAGLGYKIEALNKSRLQTEADYSSLFDRVSKLESKIS
jgi:predicted RNase H-like nuclease (RuvC/YqgF family)